MKIKFAYKALKLVTLTALVATIISNAAAELTHINPMDEVSNPKKLDYKDVEVQRPDFAEPFLRDGVIDQPQRLQQLRKGVPSEQALALLGEPIKRKNGTNGEEWDYNIKFKMSDSENYMVCQYKLIIDENTKVIENTVWRRRQCLNIVNAVQH